MKKSILFLFALSLMVVSCHKKEKDEPTKKTTLESIVKEFKFIDGVSTADVSKSALADMNAWVTELNAISKDAKAERGKAGKLGKRYVNTRGVETVQLIKKGLIGALQLSQFNNALMAGAMGAKTAEARKAAVDKAVKYLLGTKELKTRDEYKKDGNAFGKYMISVAGSEKYKDIDKKIVETIETAYANVDKKEEYTKALLDLNKYVVTVVAFRAVHYMAKYTPKVRENFDGESVHELSEGLGFAYSLQFAYKPHGQYHLSAEEAKKITEVNLWSEEGKKFVEEQAEVIAKRLGFEVKDAI